MTSFSILMSRFQGDLAEQVRGTLGIERLKGGDRVLVAETCSHHPVGEDIGRVKIPRWLTQYVGAKLEFVHVQGRDFPDDLAPLPPGRPLRQLHRQPPGDAQPHPPLPGGRACPSPTTA